MGPNDWLDTETEEQMHGLERSDWLAIAAGLARGVLALAIIGVALWALPTVGRLVVAP